MSMRDNWNRATQTLEFTTGELNKMIEPAFPNQRVVASFYTQGGLANTNIKMKLSEDKPTFLILRVFVRDPAQAEKEYKIYKRLAGLVPVPKVYYFSPTNPTSGHPYILMEHVEGDRLETVAAGYDTSWSVELGKSVGHALAAIHSVTFPEHGFLDGNLNVSTPLAMDGDGFVEFGRQCLQEGIGGERLGPELTKEVLHFMKMEAPIFREWRGEPCLTHSDFGGSNILCSRSPMGWRVGAVLDWEFAFSGTPFIDFGNLLRQPLGIIEGFEDAVYHGYIASGGMLPPNWKRLSLLADMTAWLDFLTRPEANERLISDARSVIFNTMTKWYQQA